MSRDESPKALIGIQVTESPVAAAETDVMLLTFGSIGQMDQTPLMNVLY